MSFSYITSKTSFTNSMTVFWLIFCVGLLLLILKTAKYILKWRKNELTTTQTLTQLNGLIDNFVQVLINQQRNLQPDQLQI